jgi:hypothetical protein
MEVVLNDYITNPNPTPIQTPNPNRNPNSNPNQINEKSRKKQLWKLIKLRNVSLVDGKKSSPHQACSMSHGQIIINTAEFNVLFKPDLA